MIEEEKIELSADDSPPVTERNVVNEASQSDNEVTQPSTIINEPSTNMEVQKHPHHVMHKKKWGEYLLEFFMLFLAVFLGFVAENVREGQVDKHKEKEYMVSLLSDLKQDTISANKTIDANSLFIKGYDSTLNFLASNLEKQDTAELALVYFYKYCIYETFIRVADGTISQLKNNGGLRLLKNQEVISYINEYYNELAVARRQEVSIGEFLVIIDKQAGQIFNYVANKDFIDSANASEANVYDLPQSQLNDWLSHGTPTMLTTDNKDLSPFMSNMSYQKGLMIWYISELKTLKKEATQLIQLIEKNYHLENE
jgi:hypothetical protein